MITGTNVLAVQFMNLTLKAPASTRLAGFEVTKITVAIFAVAYWVWIHALWCRILAATRSMQEIEERIIGSFPMKMPKPKNTRKGWKNSRSPSLCPRTRVPSPRYLMNPDTVGDIAQSEKHSHNIEWYESIGTRDIVMNFALTNSRKCRQEENCYQGRRDDIYWKIEPEKRFDFDILIMARIMTRTSFPR